ncbi:AAA family ATPase [Jannaschia formosa]|uniref:AAA family ATPase n=1 Tax=Jannaschia formosa TaxID=2259592 RepID=UPI001431646F|nr:AAA family ATPase [Jannaschia formosa]
MIAISATSPAPIGLPHDFRRRALAHYVSRRREREVEAVPDPASPIAPHAEHSVITLALIARISRALAGLDCADAILPGATLVLRSDEDPVDLARAYERDVCPALVDALGIQEARPGVLVALDTARGDPETLHAATRTAIEHALSRGAILCLHCPPGASLPASLRSVTAAELVLPPLVVADILDMLDVAGAPVPDRLRDGGDGVLSADADCSCLDTVQLVHAWVGADAAAVMARLRAALEDPSSGVGKGERDAPAMAPRLRDLHGLGPARTPFDRVVADIADWRAGVLSWADVGASFLLHGPPGVGKTSVAAALAREVGGPLIDMSYSVVQAAGHLGLTLAEMDARVAKAAETAPCVVLVDEADDLADRGDGADSHGMQYRRAVTNAYILRLSVLAETPGVVVVLASNHPGRIDPALIRAGRCDHHVELRLPDREALSRILLQHVGHAAEPAVEGRPDWERAVRDLVGRSGADAAHAAREAIALARERSRQDGRRSDRTVTAEDVLTAVRSLLSGASCGLADLHRMAVHEAGHLVAAHVLGRPPHRRAWIGATGGGVEGPASLVFTAVTARAELTVLLAGRAAEARIIGDISSGSGDGPGSDLARARLLAGRMVGEWRLVDVEAPPFWRRTSDLDEPDRAAAVDLVAEADARALELVRDAESDIERVSEALLKERDLSQTQIADLLEGIPYADAASRQRIH